MALRRWGRAGGEARAAKLSAAERRRIAALASQARWRAGREARVRRLLAAAAKLEALVARDRAARKAKSQNRRRR